MIGISPCFLNPAVCVVTTIGGGAFSALFSGAENWVAGSSAWAWHELGVFLNGTSQPGVVTGAARPEFRALLVAAPLVALTAFVTNVVVTLRRGEVASLLRDVALTTPLVLLVLVSAMPFASLVLSVVDGLCRSAAAPAAAALQRLTLNAGQIPSAAPGFAVMLLDLAGIIGALLLWFELVMRNAVLSLLLCLSPIIFAAALWTPMRRLAVRLVETFIAVALSKFVVVVALSLGATATLSSNVEVVVTGIAVVLLATLTPFVLLRLVPFVEQSALHALEGTRQRATGTARRVGSVAANAAGAMMPQPDSGPPVTPPDLGLDMWPGSGELEFPEMPDEPPVAPIGKPRLRGGKVAHLRDKYGPVIGWHFDE